jgi:hypothetical protein
MSGGPVVRQDGRVVGIIAEATFESNEGGIPSRRFSHAVPIAHLLELDKVVAAEPDEASNAIGAATDPDPDPDRSG